MLVLQKRPSASTGSQNSHFILRDITHKSCTFRVQQIVRKIVSFHIVKSESIALLGKKASWFIKNITLGF